MENNSEQEPNAPKLPPPLNLSVEEELQMGKTITETQGYKSGLKLLSLVFQDDREEIARQALMHADTIQEGLNFLKS